MELLRLLVILIFVMVLLAPVYTIKSYISTETFQRILHRFDNCECQQSLKAQNIPHSESFVVTFFPGTHAN